MPSMIETFASCVVSKKEKKEGYENAVAVVESDVEKTLVLVLTLLFHVGVIFLVGMVGATLWNRCLVPSVTFAKKVTSLQILGVYILVRFFLM